jgi:NAD(P)-dependent dehydrogenase (short-subunit alcohol dehydrogenase family)
VTPDDPLDLAGANAVVTGAGGGIGGAVVELLIARRADVLGVDVGEMQLERAGALGARTLAADVGSPEGRNTVVEAAGLCDYLVLAHGIVRPKPIADTTEEDWDLVLGVNAKSAYFLCQLFGPLLRDQGSIVLLSSVSARSAASLEQSVYCASKAAVSSIARTFAHAYASRGIRVNAVLPGIVDTPMQEQFLTAAAAARGTTAEALHESRLRLVPLGRTSPPAELAETILWLLGPAAGYVTGQQIAVDGGLTMF